MCPFYTQSISYLFWAFNWYNTIVSGAVCCGETIEEAFYYAYHLVLACDTQLKMVPLGKTLIPKYIRVGPTKTVEKSFCEAKQWYFELA